MCHIMWLSLSYFPRAPKQKRPPSFELFSLESSGIWAPVIPIYVGFRNLLQGITTI